MTERRQLNSREVMIERFEAEGRRWLRSAVSPANMMAIENYCHAEGRPGVRLNLNFQRRRLFGPESEIGAQVQKILPGAFPVRLIAFDKTEENNWALPWHQDRVIAVKQKGALPGFVNWSKKGVHWHCEAPVSILSRMVFARLHLDPGTNDNGAMEVAVGSHRKGYIKAGNATAMAENLPTEICLAERGDILILKMLTLHRSQASHDGAPRRAIRIDYAAEPLPSPLEWAFDDIAN